MIRMCRQCNKEYNGLPRSSLCPDCIKAAKQTTIGQRRCRACGGVFQGGPRAWYCATCRKERQRAQGRDHYHRKAEGKTRLIGSDDICVLCGSTYQVMSGLQRYCPACAPTAWTAADREQGRAYYAAHADPVARRQQGKKHTAERLCVICGKLFRPEDASVTCSPECSAALSRQNAEKWEKTHRQQRNEYQRKRYKRKKEVNQ